MAHIFNNILNKDINNQITKVNKSENGKLSEAFLVIEETEYYLYVKYIIVIKKH